MTKGAIKAAIIAAYWNEATTAEDYLGVVAWDGESMGRRPESKRVYLYLVPVALAPEFCAECSSVQEMSPASLPAGKVKGWHLRLKTQPVKAWLRDNAVYKFSLGVSVAEFEETGKEWVMAQHLAGHGDANLGWFAEKCVAELVGMKGYTPLTRNIRQNAQADIEAGTNWTFPHALIEVKVCLGTHLGQIGAFFE